MLARWNARALVDARIAVQGPPRWGQGPFAKSPLYQKTSKMKRFAPILFVHAG